MKCKLRQLASALAALAVIGAAAAPAWADDHGHEHNDHSQRSPERQGPAPVDRATDRGAGRGSDHGADRGAHHGSDRGADHAGPPHEGSSSRGGPSHGGSSHARPSHDAGSHDGAWHGGPSHEGPSHDGRWHGAPSHGPAPFHGGTRWHLDQRYHHNHYYPPRGYSVPLLPRGALSIGYRGGNYFFDGGVWFRPFGGRFVVALPPIGIVVPALPPSYATLWVDGAPEYYANGVYYAPAPDGYAVVEPPADADVQEPEAAPPADAPQAPVIYPRNGQSPAQTDADHQACERWAGTQPNAADDGDVFQRALEACLDGRGYTVR